MSQAETLRVAFKEGLSKLNEIDTRTHGLRDLQVLVTQNKTTNNLRIWLSVLSENRKKHSQSQIQVIAYIIKQYGKGLLDPLDKIPSLQKSVFRVTELIIKFFGQTHQNVQLACQAAWLEIYETTLRNQLSDMKKKLLYNNLEAIINGGGGKLAQTTAQIVVDGLLERALSLQDHQFFKQIAKRTLVLFLKTTINHSSTLTCMQTILGFFNIMNLLPLLDNIISKILLYINSAQNNSTGYKIKGEACNCLGLIGEQIDSNGVPIYERIQKVLGDLATDKVWAVQAPGRRAIGIWKAKKKEWDHEFNAKNERIGQEADNIKFEPSPLENLKQNISQFPRTYQDNWMPSQKQINHENHNNLYHDKPISKTEYQNNVWVKSNQVSQEAPRTTYPHQNYSSGNSYNQPREKSPVYQTVDSNGYLQKNTGMGGGNNVQSVEQYYERQKSQDTYQKKMQELKKSIYNPRSEIQFEDTIVLDENNNKNREKSKNTVSRNTQVSKKKVEEEEEEGENDFLDQWETVLQMAERQKFEQAVKILLEMDDDIYFLRFFLKYSSELLGNLTRPTSNKVLRKMLQIKKTNFMEQLLFKMVAESIKTGVGQMLSNSQNLVIMNHLQNAKKANSLGQIANKLSIAYEKSLEE